MGSGDGEVSLGMVGGWKEGRGGLATSVTTCCCWEDDLWLGGGSGPKTGGGESEVAEYVAGKWER